MYLINEQKDLEDAICKLSKYDLLAMDTEFHRRRTYYPILSIVQISTKDDCFIIDALAVKDLKSLKTLLIDEKIVKIFHSAEQDFEIFYNLFKTLPKNVFDTQIAAGVCGMNSVLGYAKLCKELLNVNIDKTMQKADWLIRPLSDELLKYAELDTKFLPMLYRNLEKIITDRKLWDNYKTKVEKLLDINSYKPNPEKLLSRINLPNASANLLNNMLELLSFREECAQILDIPRQYCASDEDLIRLAKNLPIDDKELLKTKVMGQPITKNKFRSKLFDLCASLRK